MVRKHIIFTNNQYKFISKRTANFSEYIRHLVENDMVQQLNLSVNASPSPKKGAK